MAASLFASLVACDPSVPPDWKALYSERLGQSVAELDESARAQDEKGSEDDG
jgi:hypothetical protein